MKVMLLLLLILLSPRADAAYEWLHDIEVVKVGTYQSATGHFVWLSTTPPGCTTAVSQNPVMTFDDSKPGGKALLAVLISALVSKRKIDLQAEGCQIVEVHLK